VGTLCYSRGPPGAVVPLLGDQLRFVPQVFHNCGKRCGKTRSLGVLGVEIACIRSFQVAKVKNHLSFGRRSGLMPQYVNKNIGLLRRKSLFFADFSRLSRHGR
jgi:hypothetical protein